MKTSLLLFMLTSYSVSAIADVNLVIGCSGQQCSMTNDTGKPVICRIQLDIPSSYPFNIFLDIEQTYLIDMSFTSTCVYQKGLKKYIQRDYYGIIF